MAINRQLDNTLNKLNKQLQTARLSFGEASPQYQALAHRAHRYLAPYGLVTVDSRGTHIKRSDPKINSAHTMKDFSADLSKIVSQYADKSNSAARTKIIEDIRRDRLAAGATVAQSKKRVTQQEIVEKGEQMANTDTVIESMLKYLYDERDRVQVKHGKNSADAYARYFGQVDRMAMDIMHRKNKSDGEIMRLAEIVNRLPQVRAQLENNNTLKNPKILMIARGLLDVEIDNLDRGKIGKQYKKKYKI